MSRKFSLCFASTREKQQREQSSDRSPDSDRGMAGFSVGGSGVRWKQEGGGRGLRPGVLCTPCPEALRSLGALGSAACQCGCGWFKAWRCPGTPLPAVSFSWCSFRCLVKQISPCLGGVSSVKQLNSKQEPALFFYLFAPLFLPSLLLCLYKPARAMIDRPFALHTLSLCRGSRRRILPHLDV